MTDKPSSSAVGQQGAHTPKSLSELQALQLPRANWRDFLKAEGLTAEEEQALDTYFARFLPPGPCVKCGAKQGGDMLDAFLGTAKFQWGIAHGQGFCSAEGCRYPARAYHYDVGPIKRLSMILQYHPDELSDPKALRAEGPAMREGGQPKVDPGSREGGQ